MTGDVRIERPQPGEGPSEEDVAERTRVLALYTSGSSAVRDAAGKWGTGLTGLIGLVTGGLLIKGPEAAQDLPWWGLLAVTLLFGGGLVLAVLGLWAALDSSAGSPKRVPVTDLVEQGGSVAGYQNKVAAQAAQQLQNAKIRVGWALVLLFAAIAVWWWVPARPPSPPAYVTVTSGGSATCGTLLSADHQQVRVQVEGESQPRTFAFAAVDNLAVVASC